jgi:hypothetical protein
MAIAPNTGWALGAYGTPSQSTMPGQPTPQQVAQIQAMTGAMQQPFGSTSPQQQTMMGGLFSNPNGQNGIGQNLGSMGQSLWGSSPAFGGGNMLSGDAFGGSAVNPLAGLTADDYG